MVAPRTLALLLALIAGCASSPSAPQQVEPPRDELQPDRPQHTVELPVPTLTYLRTEVRTYGRDASPYQREMAIIELRNDTPFPFEYTAESPDWGSGTMSVWKAGFWTVPMGAVCIFGRTTQTLAPGQSVGIVAHGRTGHCRYELTMRNTETGDQVTVRSEPFDSPDPLGNG